MNSERESYVWRAARESSLAAIAAGAITLLCYSLHLNYAISGCIYLLLIVLQSTVASFVSCSIVSVVAIACLDYFFIFPIMSLRISQPIDALALITFLAAALVITQLASRARAEDGNAESRDKELTRLYELASRLVSASPEAAVQKTYLRIFRDIFDLRAVCLFDGATGEVISEGASESGLAGKTKTAYIGNTNYDEPITSTAVRCLSLSGHLIAAVGFEGLRTVEYTAGPLSILTAAIDTDGPYF